MQTFFRTTTKAIDVAGVTVGEGEKVLLFLAAANRDPRKWEAPERFDIRRKTLGHAPLQLFAAAMKRACNWCMIFVSVAYCRTESLSPIPLM